MTPERSIVEELERYDSKLVVEWNNRIHRFTISRTARDGRKQLIMRVANPDGSFRPVDRRVLHALTAADTWRFGACRQAFWDTDGRRNFMHSMGWKENQHDQFQTDMEKVEDRRYTELAEQMADQIGHHMRRDPRGSSYMDKGEERFVLEGAEQKERVAEAYGRGRGVIVSDQSNSSGTRLASEE